MCAYCNFDQMFEKNALVAILKIAEKGDTYCILLLRDRLYLNPTENMPVNASVFACKNKYPRILCMEYIREIKDPTRIEEGQTTFLCECEI